jgi:hypothetical protein
MQKILTIVKAEMLKSTMLKLTPSKAYGFEAEIGKASSL